MTDNGHKDNRNLVDMAIARSQAEVNVAKLRDFLHGGQESWDIHRKLVNIMSNDPIFDKSQRPYMTRSERYKNALKMVHHIHELTDVHAWSHREFIKAIGLIDDSSPMVLHIQAFEPVLFSQATPEFLTKYGDLIAHRGIIGCYLQTELAHGSNVAGLETTATYLPEKREFEINSPQLTSSKWWVGGAGKYATHGVLQARLILPGGQEMGPHLFLVQLRSLEDHTPLPGITLGDIGPKAMNGGASLDNGYALFDHVHIPAKNMLSKFSRVTSDGRYVRPPHAKIGYGSMMYIRASDEYARMTSSAGWTVGKGAKNTAVTIAIRYATIRRQGNKGPDGLEKQIITYPSVCNRLIPILSRAYAFLLLGRNLVSREAYESVQDALI
ncbi:hypothetical protein NM688_g6701 [Phlebia brevispora]|uniref:Uncharacterized protein n=1 Tax=Phlebia brevispora TaxID=194682 RepID=A0ACC1SDK8_9APHY|nr:hypothetical protein NM688_g6701 [Phlebia brevispora]